MAKVLPPIFEGLNDVDVYTARRRFTERELAPGEALMREGEPGTSVVCVLDGELVMTARGSVVGHARGGDIVGEIALFEQGERSATATASVPTRLLVLEREGYEGLRDTMHPLAVALERRALDQQVARLRAVGDRIAELAEGTPVQWAPPTQRFFNQVAALFGRGGIFSSEPVDALAALRRSGIFAGASEQALVAIARELKPWACGPGHFVCTEGELGTAMYLVEEGEIDVLVATEGDRVQHLVTLGPGAAFGMLSLAQEVPRMASCVARGRAVVLTLERDGWGRLIADPYLAGSVFRRAMIRALTEQLRWSNAQLAGIQGGRPDRLQRASAAVEAHGAYLGDD